VLLDPWIEGNPACRHTLADLPPIDFICVTHGHNDHLGNAIAIARRTGARLVCNPEVAIYADRKGVKYDQGSCPLNFGGSCEGKGVRLTMVPAAHTSEILGEEFDADGTMVPGGGAGGFVIAFAHGPIIYFAGDTGVFGDMVLIREIYAPQIVILPLGGKYTMGPLEAAHAVHLLRPRVVIPMHYDTFPDQKVDMQDFCRRVAVLAPDAKVAILAPGENYLCESTR